MTECQSVIYQLTHRYREQAPSHIWIVLGLRSMLRL